MLLQHTPSGARGLLLKQLELFSPGESHIVRCAPMILCIIKVYQVTQSLQILKKLNTLNILTSLKVSITKKKNVKKCKEYTKKCKEYELLKGPCLPANIKPRVLKTFRVVIWIL